MADEPRLLDDAKEKAILRAAARWLARGELGAVDHEKFEAWLADSRHALAFVRVLGAVRWATLAAEELYGEPAPECQGEHSGRDRSN